MSSLTVRHVNLHYFMIVRLLFPDSPTTAWFLTPAERAMAVQRIKVDIVPSGVNFADIVARKTKQVLKTSTSRKNSRC